MAVDKTIVQFIGQDVSLTATQEKVLGGQRAIQSEVQKTAAELDKTGSHTQRMGAQLASVEGPATGLAGKVGQLTSMLPGVGLAAAGAGFALANMAKDAIVSAAELQSAVANISTIKPEIDTSALTSQLTELSTRVPQSAKGLADGLYQIFSSVDVSSAEGVRLLEEVSKGAVGAMTDTETFGTAVMGVMNSYKLGVGDASHISDVFFNTVAAGVVTGPELAASLGPVTQAAKAAGVSLDELGGFIVGVTKEGGPAAQNINNLVNLLSKITTSEAQKEMQNLGVSTTDAAGKFRPLGEVMAELKGKLAGMTESAQALAVQKIFPDLQARQGALTIMSQLDAVNKAIDTNKTQVGSAASAYEKMSSTAAAQWQLLQNKLAAAATEIGTALLPAITSLISFVSDLIGPVMTVGRAITDVLNPAFKLLGILGEVVGGVLAPIGWIFDSLGQKADGAGQGVMDASSKVEAGMLLSQQAVETGVSNMGDSFAQGATDAQQYGTETGEGYGANTSYGISNKVSDVSDSVSDVMGEMDTQDDAGTMGESVGTRYGSGTPGGVAPGIRSTQGDVSSAAAGLVSAMDKRAEAAAVGQSVGQAYGINVAAGAIAGAQTLGIDITGKKVAGPSGIMIPNAPKWVSPGSDIYDNRGGLKPQVFNPDYEKPYVPGTFDPTGNKNYGPGYGAPPPPLTDEDVERANRPGGGNYVPPAHKAKVGGGGGGGGSGADPAKAAQAASDKAAREAEAAAKKADNIADAARGLDASLNEARAKQAVDDAQKKLNADSEKYGDILEDLHDKRDALAAEEKTALAGHAAAIKEQEAELARMGAVEAQVLNTDQQAIDRVTASLNDMKAAAQAAYDAWDAESHTLRNSLYDLENAEKAALAPRDAEIAGKTAALNSEREALDALTASFDRRIEAEQEQLQLLNEEQSKADRAKDLHDQQVGIENLTARLATATGAEREHLQAQLATAQGQKARDEKKGGIEDRIASLEHEKKSAVDAATAAYAQHEQELAQVQALRDAEAARYEAQRQQIADRQREIEHDRSNYEFEERQKEEAAQKDIDRAQRKYDADSKLYDDMRVIKQGQIEEDRAAMAAEQGEYDQRLINMDAVIVAKGKEAKAVEDADKRAVDSANATKTTLSDAYAIIEKIDSAHDRGASLTVAQSAALEAAKKTIAEIIPTLPQLSGAYSAVKTSIDATHGEIKGSVHVLWDKTQPLSIPDQYKKGFEALDLQTKTALDFNRHDVWGNSMNVLKELVGNKIGAVATDAGTKAEAVGAAIDGGVAKGITDNAHLIGDALNSAVDAAIQGAQDHLQASSPSDVTATEIGLPIAWGVAEGISRGAPMIDAALTKALAPLMGGLPGGNNYLGGVGGPGNVYVDVKLEVRGAGLPKDQRVYDEIATQIKRAIGHDDAMSGRRRV